jgi:hypothetical protein
VDGVEQFLVGLELNGAVDIDAAVTLSGSDQISVEVQRDVHGEGEWVEG